MPYTFSAACGTASPSVDVSVSEEAYTGAIIVAAMIAESPSAIHVFFI